MSHYHLAQFNYARMVAPLDSPLMAGFLAGLDELNALAEVSPGFVWRHADENNSSTSLRPFPDKMRIITFSVWEDVETLKHYTYKTAHGKFMARRREWFEKVNEAYLVMWWVPAGYIPSVDEAKAKLAYLQAHGPSPAAFNFRTVFPPAD
ncbi:MAG: DUF3291 domain-containing protein [Anaerolineae bacterium]|nr:DUF3291 domain-containing protein [Anaerolineae bacterium]